MKKAAAIPEDDDTPPAPTLGVKWARENRSKCNNLTDKERADLMAQAMVMIYGETAQKASARRH
ncbi:MAG: hypothetical protein IPK32_22340 [Verrucomicrobiaceae bacterium]|nr:hypothetical protein [Verrucomicrobiaceae bacterium]